jgi:thymidylate synthase
MSSAAKKATELTPGRFGRNQIAAVLETLRRDAHASYATITTLEPLTDVSYIPCVSLLDFWLRSGSLELGACPSSGGIFVTNLIRFEA